MKSSVGKGAFVLVVSGFICKLFGAFFRLPLTNILGIDGIGTFQMVMSLYSLALVLVSGGMTSSLAKLVSSSRASGDVQKLGGYLKKAVTFVLGVGLSLGVAFALLSNQIASVQGGTSGGSNCYLLMVFLLPLGGLIGVCRGIIQGYEVMSPTAISQIIEQISKFAFGLIFAYFLSKSGQGAGVFGAFLGIVLSEILALAYLFFAMGKTKIKPNNTPVQKEFYSAVLPLTAGNAVLPLTHAIESLIIVALLTKTGLEASSATALYGLQTGVVGTVLNFPLVISLAFSISILPKISYLSSQDDTIEQRNVIKKGFLVMWFFLIPMVFALVAMSKNLYAIIFPSVINDFSTLAQDLTLLGGFGIVLCAIMQLLLSILQAKGFFLHSCLFSLIGGSAKVLLLVILTPLKGVGIYAIAISNIVLYSIVCVCALIYLKDVIRVDAIDLLLPLASALIMFLVIKILLSFNAGLLWLLACAIIGGSVYLVMAYPITKRITLLLLSSIKKGHGA